MIICAEQKQRKRFLWQLVTVLTLLFMVSFSMTSCSTTEYDTPLTSQTTFSSLISPEILNIWIASGIVNSTGYDRVVILDVTSLTVYNAGHIPGAQFLNSGDLYQNRQEGPAVDINMSLDGLHMDAIVQRYGIDKNTTLVFTSGAASPGAGSVLSATRAYWTFRYWGFPKEKLKVLDGINFAYQTKYGLTATASPAPVPSTHSVKNNASLRIDLRASLADMINVAEGKVANAVPVDMRSSEIDGSYIGKRGSTAGVFTPGSGANNDNTVFEGRLKGAKALLYSSMLESAANNFRFKSPSVLAGMFNAIGINSAKLTHVY
jgi:3-mercaptopyruvate sulfurtransferase SseA